MKVKALLKAAVLGCVLACGSVAITGFGGSTVAASSYGSEYILLTGYGNMSYLLKKILYPSIIIILHTIVYRPKCLLIIKMAAGKMA